MEQLHENLLYVRKLLLSMDNLNQQERQLQAQMKPLLSEKVVEVKKWKMTGPLLIIMVLFVFSVLLGTLTGASNTENAQIEYDNVVFNDTMRWYAEHDGETYPGYTGDAKPSITFSEGIVRSIPIAIANSLYQVVPWAVTRIANDTARIANSVKYY